MSAETIDVNTVNTAIPLPRAELRMYVRELVGSLPIQHPWRSQDSSERCQECSRENPCWWVQPDIWEAIMLANSRMTICPACFIRRAETMGLGTHGTWQLYPPGQLF